MDKRSIFFGMALGAGIAFSGMILGGAAQQQHKIEHFDRITCHELLVINDRQQTLVRLADMKQLGLIEVRDANNNELVRISGVLKGGGIISTKENGRTMNQIGSTPQGGFINVQRAGGGNAIYMAGTNLGGFLYTYDDQEQQTGAVPEEQPVTKQE